MTNYKRSNDGAGGRRSGSRISWLQTKAVSPLPLCHRSPKSRRVGRAAGMGGHSTSHPPSPKGYGHMSFIHKQPSIERPTHMKSTKVQRYSMKFNESGQKIKNLFNHGWTRMGA